MGCYTCSGDNGTTSIIGKCGIEKDDDLIEAIGSFDELNAAVGVAASFAESPDTQKLLKMVQDDLHTICAELAAAVKDMPKITERHVENVEMIIEDAEKFLEPQKSFILPGGTKEASFLQLARTIARRAERQLVTLSKEAELNQNLLKYSNRLSSLFHVMARVENKRQSVAEVMPSYRYCQRNSF